MKTIFLLFSLLLSLNNAHAFELITQKVTDNVYALVGEIGPRTQENLGLNNTVGFIITSDGVVLVGSGPSEEGAKLIEASIKKVTDKPIKLVMNIASQDHHWMGNTYFLSQKIPVMALNSTVETQKENLDGHIARLEGALKITLDKGTFKHATNIIKSDRKAFNVGETDFEICYLGDAHFPGDAVLWLPKQKLIFTADMVYHDRMLGIQPYSKAKPWLATFNKMARLKPEFVIPGHGYAGSLAKAKKDTGDYLEWLVSEVSKAKEDWEDLGDMVKRLSETTQFDYLKFHETWNPVNLNRTYLQLEAE
jgi:glyoxylase-like metal-dependent hydrolase (beta-lactamase superfamily II)